MKSIPKEICFGKNVSLKAGNIQVIQGFQHKTKKNFSATLNIIVEQWDKFSIIIAKYQREHETKQELKKFDQMKKAEVIKK